MDQSFFNEMNRQLDKFRQPFGDLQSLIDKHSILYPPSYQQHLDNNFPTLQIRLELDKWQKFIDTSADHIAFRNALIQNLQPELLKTMSNFEAPYLAIPPEILAQKDFVHEYLERLKPAGYSIDFYKEYSIQTSTDEIIRFEYDLDVSSSDEKSEKGFEERTFVKGARHVRDIIHKVHLDNSKLKTVDPRDFEKMIAELMYEKGFEVELTKQTRDGGKDIIALKTIGGLPMKFLVECKRLTKGNVGIEVVSRFYDVVLNIEKANKGIIFTTASFTDDAHKRRAIDPWHLDFMDREEILKWVSDYTLGKR